LIIKPPGEIEDLEKCKYIDPLKFPIGFLLFKKNLIWNIANKSLLIPGGQDVHPSVPLDEKLENVPTGHGRKY